MDRDRRHQHDDHLCEWFGGMTTKFKRRSRNLLTLCATLFSLCATAPIAGASLPAGTVVLARADTATAPPFPTLVWIDDASYASADLHAAFILGLTFPADSILAYEDGGAPVPLDTSLTTAAEMHVHHFDPTQESTQALLLAGSALLEEHTLVDTTSGTRTIAELLSPAGSFLVAHVAVPEPGFGAGLIVGGACLIGPARRKKREDRSG